MQKILAPVIKVVREAKDHTGALQQLVDLFPDVPLDDLQESLARAIFVLDTWGRLNVEK
jgi:phage gp29-like protein